MASRKRRLLEGEDEPDVQYGEAESQNEPPLISSIELNESFSRAAPRRSSRSKKSSRQHTTISSEKRKSVDKLDKWSLFQEKLSEMSKVSASDEIVRLKSKSLEGKVNYHYQIKFVIIVYNSMKMI